MYSNRIGLLDGTFNKTISGYFIELVPAIRSLLGQYRNYNIKIKKDNIMIIPL